MNLEKMCWWFYESDGFILRKLKLEQNNLENRFISMMRISKLRPFFAENCMISNSKRLAYIEVNWLKNHFGFGFRMQFGKIREKKVSTQFWRKLLKTIHSSIQCVWYMFSINLSNLTQSHDHTHRISTHTYTETTK